VCSKVLRLPESETLINPNTARERGVGTPQLVPSPKIFYSRFGLALEPFRNLVGQNTRVRTENPVDGRVVK
jgi:hypothetical protein